MSHNHFLHVFATFCAAGPQVRAAALMRGLGPDYRHTVVAADGRTEATELVGDVELNTVSYQPKAGALGAVRFIRDLINSSKPDLVLSYNWGAIDTVIAARSLGWQRLVHHEDGFNLDEAHRLKTRRTWTRRLALRNYDVIVPSRRLEGIARNTWKLPRLHRIPNGIDATKFERDVAQGESFRATHGIPADALIVGAVGHLRPVKNYGRLIRTISATGLPVHLLLIGDGSERGKLESEASQHGVRTTFTGHITGLRAAYSAIDIFAISSDSEQQPVSLLEAMAAGLPVCGTDVGDVRISLPDESHPFIVPLGTDSENELATVLKRLAANKSLRSGLGVANLQHVKQHYSEQAMLAAYAAVYIAAQAR